MNRHLWLLVTGCCWAAMMALLFHREIKPYFEYQQPPTYRVMLRDMKEPEVQRRSVHFASQQVGESETLLMPLDSGSFLMKTRMAMRMQPFLSMTLPDDRTLLESEVVVDEAYQLASFKIDGRMQGIRISIRGVRLGEKLRVTYDMFLKGEQTVDFPRDATLSDSFMPYQGGGRLAVGKKWRIRMLDPTSFVSLTGKNQIAFTDAYAAVVSCEPFKFKGRHVEAFKVEVRKNASDDIPAWSLWVDREGTVLQQLMEMYKLPCVVVLDERRKLTAAEAAAYRWGVETPR